MLEINDLNFVEVSENDDVEGGIAPWVILAGYGAYVYLTKDTDIDVDVDVNKEYDISCENCTINVGNSSD